MATKQPSGPFRKLHSAIKNNPIRSCAIVIGLGALATLNPFGGFIFHVASNFRLHGIAAAIIVGLVCAIYRRWPEAVALTLVAATILSVSWMPRAERHMGELDPDTYIVNIMHFNIWSFNKRHDQIIDLLREPEADIISLRESPTAITEFLRDEDNLADRWPYRLIPPEPYNGLPIIMSRWSITDDPDLTFVPRRIDRFRTPTVIVSSPGGDFLLSQIHPPSPTNPSDKVSGNQVLRTQSQRLAHARAATGIPIVVAADLNGTEKSYRGHKLHRLAGVRPTRRLRDISGTWHSLMPGPLRVGIDDIWVTDDIRVMDRRQLPRTGSDHVPVMAALVMPRFNLNVPDADGAHD